MTTGIYLAHEIPNRPTPSLLTLADLNSTKNVEENEEEFDLAITSSPIMNRIGFHPGWSHQTLIFAAFSVKSKRRREQPFLESSLIEKSSFGLIPFSQTSICDFDCRLIIELFDDDSQRAQRVTITPEWFLCLRFTGFRCESNGISPESVDPERMLSRAKQSAQFGPKSSEPDCALLSEVLLSKAKSDQRECS
ncbi:hypothetical protein L2E82_45453 [Cichorium intybus]|uniref:Uncharacterized protein n=1 Tax=Cichorium intybus TaxID=13427 RepID=A0ACB8ZTW6_CICIN|nr:hypothetical protein L2E82_45453 [Cichorium intybus]